MAKGCEKENEFAGREEEYLAYQREHKFEDDTEYGMHTIAGAT